MVLQIPRSPHVESCGSTAFSRRVMSLAPKRWTGIVINAMRVRHFSEQSSPGSVDNGLPLDAYGALQSASRRPDPSPCAFGELTAARE